MNRHDGFGSWGDGGFNRFHVDAQGGRVHIHQHHISPQVTHHLGGGGEGVGGGDDLIARANAQGFKRQVQTRSGGVHGQAVQACVFGKRAQKRSELSLKPFGLGAGGEPAGFQGVDHFGDLFVTDFGQSEREKGQVTHGLV